MTARPLTERFWSKVDRSGGPDACWPFMGKARTGRRKAWGKIQTGGRGSPVVATHRLAYALAVSPVPAGVDVHHTCEGGGLCCNPAHLAPVPHAEHGAMMGGGLYFGPGRALEVKDEEKTLSPV